VRKTFTIFAIVSIAFVVLIAGCRKKPQQQAGDGNTQSESVGGGAGLEWITDFESAKSKAGREGKDLFINFSGSDWCGWCKLLDREVFSRAEFVQKAGQSFVFVLADFPRDTSGQTKAVQQQNQRLSDRYKVEGFPTVILADSAGREYARTGYVEGGPVKYLKYLEELRRTGHK